MCIIFSQQTLIRICCTEHLHEKGENLRRILFSSGKQSVTIYIITNIICSMCLNAAYKNSMFIRHKLGPIFVYRKQVKLINVLHHFIILPLDFNGLKFGPSRYSLQSKPANHYSLAINLIHWF